MTESSGPLILGVDGGGTNTIAWLARVSDDGSFEVMGKGCSGPSNVHNVGPEKAFHHLSEAMDAARADAGLQAESIAAACLALAGSARVEMQQQITQWAEQIQLATKLHITHDAFPVLCSAAADGVGVALIAGTGSIAFGSNEHGQTARSGGLGPDVGDKGSGLAIALQGLQAAVESATQPLATTSLCTLFLQELNLETVSELEAVIAADVMDRPTIAGLAKIVFQACDQGDRQAHAIMQQAAEDLAQLVMQVIHELEMHQDSIRLAMAGGVLLHRRDVRDHVLATLKQQGLTVIPTIVAEPVRGTLQLALRTWMDSRDGECGS